MTTATSGRDSALAFVKGLPAETKNEIVYSLLSELVTMWGTGPIPFTTPDGEPFGYYVPREAAAEDFRRFADTIPESIRERLTSPLPAGIDLDDCLTDEELAAIRSAVDSSIPSQ